MKMNLRTPKLLLLMTVAILMASCTGNQTTEDDAPEVMIRNDWDDYFQGKQGCMVVYEPSTGITQLNNQERSEKEFSPASTFKIFNAMAGLEEQAVFTVDETIAWDGTDKGWEKWNKDQTMQTAMEYSCVWFFQTIADRVGEPAMQKHLTENNYGNMLMGPLLNSFWLDGELKISAMDQVDFLDRWRKRELTFSPAVQDKVYNILTEDDFGSFTMKSKTGWSIRTDGDIGWLVGFAEKEGKSCVFAMNLDLREDEDGNLRKDIASAILKTEFEK